MSPASIANDTALTIAVWRVSSRTVTPSSAICPRGGGSAAPSEDGGAVAAGEPAPITAAEIFDPEGEWKFEKCQFSYGGAQISMRQSGQP